MTGVQTCALPICFPVTIGLFAYTANNTIGAIFQLLQSEISQTLTSDAFGGVSFSLRNRFTSPALQLGALLTNSGLDIVTLGFKPKTGAQHNLTLEHGNGTLMDSANSTGEFQFNDAAASTYTFFYAGQQRVGIHINNSTTNAVDPIFTLRHNSTGTAAAGFGARQLWTLESSTTADTSAASIDVAWNTATHASRKADMIFYAYDTAAREFLRGQGNGSAAAIGFLGATPVVQDTGWSVTNVSADRSYDASATTLNEIANVLGTLIASLKSYGLLGS